ncbi:MAG: hydrolase [Nitratiruptor sp.]|nr:hydrolase [Nitratiruptor sp.]NPA82996.1 HAD family hydrolase [Campylobacterota bacterium]
MKRVSILFDLDGTLIDSSQAIVESFTKACLDLGKEPPSPQEVLRLVGHPLEQIFLYLLDIPDPQPFVERYKAHYRQVFLEQTRLLPFVREGIERAFAFAQLGVVTSKTGLYSRQLLEHFGLLPFFAVVIGSEDTHHLKPHPEGILKALHKMGGRVEHSWMVGDTCLDVEAANRAEIGSIAVTCGYGRVESLKRCARILRSNTLEAVKEIKWIESIPG